jgi:hypothetical protein
MFASGVSFSARELLNEFWAVGAVGLRSRATGVARYWPVFLLFVPF